MFEATSNYFWAVFRLKLGWNQVDFGWLWGHFGWLYVGIVGKRIVIYFYLFDLSLNIIPLKLN